MADRRPSAPPPIVAPSRRRYLLAFAILLAPCVALAGWAWRAERARAEHEQAALADAWRQLGDEAASAAVRDRLDAAVAALRLAPAAGDGGPRVAAWWDRCARVGIDTAFAWKDDELRPLRAAPTPRPPPPRAADPALAEARRLEFVAGDLAGAAAAYAALAAASADPGTRAEAIAGQAAVAAKRDRLDAAAAALLAALPDDGPARIAPETAAAFALGWCDGGLEPTGLPELLLAIAQAAVAMGDDATLARALPQLTARAAALPAAAAAQRDALSVAIERGRRVQAAVDGLGLESRAWLAGIGDDPAWRDDGEVALLALRREGETLVAAIPHPPVIARAAAALAANPALAALGDAFAARSRGAPAATAADAKTPWGATLAVPLPARAAGAAGWSAGWRDDLPLIAALAVIAAGFVLLWRTAGRDLALARMRADFVANTTHELRTPLALMRVHAEMLSLGYEKDEAERRRWHGIILRETRRLGDLIDDVLHLAAVERGTKTYVRERLDLAAAAGEVIETWRPQLEAQGFAIDAALEPAAVLGDRDALTQALINLVSNAAKYSGDARASPSPPARTTGGRCSRSPTAASASIRASSSGSSSRSTGSSRGWAARPAGSASA